MAGGAREPIDTRGLDEREHRVVFNVENYGTDVEQIAASPDDDGFSFTIGLQFHHDHPELIVFGQQPPWQHSLLNSLRDEIQSGARFEHNSVCTTVLEGFRLTFRDVPEERLAEYFGCALWFYRNVAPADGPLRALQVVWPDLSDVLPWEAGYRSGYRQPMLDGTPNTAPANRFPIGLEAGVFSCARVAAGAPVLYVSHDGESAERPSEYWDFLCGANHADELEHDELQWVHLVHVLEVDEGPNVLADLDVECFAERAGPSDAWVRNAHDSDDSEETER